MMSRVQKGIKTKTQRGLARAGAYGVFAIGEHTRKGKGVVSGNLTAFKPYSSAYTKRKREGWEGFGGTNDTTVNLTVTGRMLSSMVFKIHGDNAILFFGRRREAEKAIWNHKTRPFFDLSTKERNKARAVFFKEIRKAIR